jgi:hypothetical protein
MDVIKQKIIVELGQAREELLSFKRDFLTSNFLFNWFKQHETLWGKTQRYNVYAWPDLYAKLDGFQQEKDVDVLDALRAQLVEVIDRTIKKLDSQIVLNSALHSRIERIKDTKLATLLLELEAVKDIAPNIAAMGFSTILTLVIQERAKQVNPASALATRTDLDVDPMIRDALRENIFSYAEAIHLSRFANGGQKTTFDNITHKPGALYLIDKSTLEDAVDLLNILLASIID